ncbi:Uncharacterized protein Adt_31612 [Abeliophyllum distichum]|uniref:Uncharacterized protein n=1 Tax=Abeliophyllum distichum TaxID=126358 RepID=A0ABD1RFD5_9LAMI
MHRVSASSTGTRTHCSLLLPMERHFTQVPLPLGLGHLVACSSYGATLRASDLSHWDSATLQLAHLMEQRFTQGPLLLGLVHLAACSSCKGLSHLGLGHLATRSSDGATLRARASPTWTRPPCNSLLPWSDTSPPPMKRHFAQVPLSLELSHLAACSSH